MEDNSQKMAELERMLENNEPQEVEIRGKVYHIGDVKEWVFDKIIDYAVPMMQMKDTIITNAGEDYDDFQRAYDIYKKYRKNFAKISSLFILGRSNLKAFFFHWIYWRILRSRFTEKDHYNIYQNVVNDPRLVFFYLSFNLVAQVAKTRMMMLREQQSTSEARQE